MTYYKDMCQKNNTQIASKNDYCTTRYFKLDSQVKDLESSLNVKFKKTI